MTVEPPRPGFLAWTFSILSTLAVAGVVCGVVLFTRTLYLARLHARFTAALTAQTNLAPLLADADFAPLTEPVSKQLRRLADLLALLKAGEFRSALNNIPSNADTLSSQADVLRARIDDILQLSAASDATARDAEQVAAKSKILRSQYTALREKEAEFLRISAYHAAVPEDDEVPFYSDGVLAGLPIVPGIADGLADTAALQAAAPGTEGMESERFASQLEQLRAESKALHELAAFVAEKNTALAQLQDDSESRLKDAQAAGMAIVTQTAANVTRPQLSVTARRLYSALAPVFGRASIELPPLP